MTIYSICQNCRQELPLKYHQRPGIGRPRGLLEAWCEHPETLGRSQKTVLRLGPRGQVSQHHPKRSIN